MGRRMGGAPAEAVLSDVQQRTAEQLFRTLGDLKGGAMKVGQALSILESALPEELAAPVPRPADPAAGLRSPDVGDAPCTTCSPRELGTGWREQLVEFDDEPAAAASIGQVHRGRWADGREVAVKVQYPGAGEALMSDLRQISRLARTFGALVPGIDIKPLVAELQDRVAEELDYALEAEAQHAFAEAFRDDPDVPGPRRGRAHRQGAGLGVGGQRRGSLARLIAEGSQEERDHYGELYVRFLFEGPARVGHAARRPAPGQLPDPARPRTARSAASACVDYGAVARLPEHGLPRDDRAR